MYYLYGLDYHRHNLREFFGQGCLKTNYDEFISKNSVFDQVLNLKEPLVINFKQLKNIAPSYYKANTDFFDSNPTELDLKIKENYFSSGITALEKAQPDLYAAVCFYMKVVVINYLTKYIEGTTDKTLGLSCMDFKNHYVREDFYELLFHQIVHKMMFIDNRLKPQLLSQFEHTTITTSFMHKGGGNDFSLYMGFHSFLVGVEILRYRQLTNTLNFKGNYHGSTESIIKKSKRGYNLLDQYKHFFTEHGQEILFRANTFLNTLTEENIYGHGDSR